MQTLFLEACFYTCCIIVSEIGIMDKFLYVVSKTRILVLAHRIKVCVICQYIITRRTYNVLYCSNKINISVAVNLIFNPFVFHNKIPCIGKRL